MSDITVTVASVEPVYSAAVPPDLETRIAGETVTAGQPLYENTAQKDYRNRPKLYKCDADAAQASALCYGIALHAAANNHPVTVIRNGFLRVGAAGGSVLTAGETYYVSATSGGIAPGADVTTDTDMYPCALGVADDVGVLQLLGPFRVGAAVNA